MKSLPHAQARALKDARDYGNPTHSLRGRSEFGGWAWTKRRLVLDGYLDKQSQITDLGRWRLALHLGEIPKGTPAPDPEAASPPWP